MENKCKSVKLLCDAHGFIQKVLLLPGNECIEWTFDMVSETDGEEDEKMQNGEKNSSLVEKTKLKLKKNRVPDEALKTFEKKINGCEYIVQAVAFFDAVDDENYHRVPRGVSIQWKSQVCANFTNFDFCRGVSVQKLAKIPSACEWKKMLERASGYSIGDPGIALEKEIDVLKKYVLDIFPDDPIIRSSFQKKRPKNGPEGWKPQLTIEGKANVFVRNDGKIVEYFVIVEDGLPPWTGEQIGILLDDCWTSCKPEEVVHIFNSLNALSTARRKRIIDDMVVDRHTEFAQEIRKRGSVVTNTFAYDGNSSVWYTGNSFMNHEPGWYALPKTRSNDYIDVLLDTKTVQLKSYIIDENVNENVNKTLFQSLQLTS